MSYPPRYYGEKHGQDGRATKTKQSSLPDQQHPARRDRTHIFNSELFKREFVVTPAELRAGDTAA
jgi:hypothetical protein